MERLGGGIRFFILIVWLLLSTVIFIPWLLVRMRHPSLFKDFLVIFARPALKILGVEVEYSGLTKSEIERHQPCVFVGNHQSGLDVITFGALGYDRTVAVGKKEIIYLPIFGQIFWACGGILIDRKRSADAIQRIARVGKVMRSRNVSIVMMPEGTRNKVGHGFLPFKKGAFRIAMEAQVPIVPIVCSSLQGVLDPETRMIRPGRIKIRVLPPIPTAGLSALEIDRLIEETRSRMWNAYVELNG